MSEPGFLDIFILPDTITPVVRLQVRAEYPCWVNLTPEQAHGAGAKLLECAFAIASRRATPEAEPPLWCRGPLLQAAEDLAPVAPATKALPRPRRKAAGSA